VQVRFKFFFLNFVCFVKVKHFVSYRIADFVLCWLVFCAFGLVSSAHHVKRLTAVKNIPEMAHRCVMLILTQSIKTYGRTQGHGKYRGCIASCGKNLRRRGIRDCEIFQ